ncbi:hypothetical protein TNCV_4592241 [Trichonephila clavipes]|nr:hypothetical protein TNCV_4592241 [Trichonephila clavipes]
MGGRDEEAKFERGRVIEQREGGFSFHDIAQRLGRNIFTVFNCLEQWARDGTASRRPERWLCGTNDMEDASLGLYAYNKSDRGTTEDAVGSVEEKINGVVKEKMKNKLEEKIEKIKEQAAERIEEVTGNFSRLSQGGEDLENKLLAGGHKNERKIVHVPGSPVPKKLSNYDGKTNWEVY